MKNNLNKVELLKANGRLRTRAFGNSMKGLLASGQYHMLESCVASDCVKGDIVFCRFGRVYLTHLVKAVGDRGVLVCNAKGMENGWTKNVYGKVIDKF